MRQHPFSRQTTVEYTVPEGKQQAEIVVREMVTGKIVKRQAVAVQENNVVLQVPELASGLYIYSLIADGEVLATDKMMILNSGAYE